MSEMERTRSIPPELIAAKLAEAHRARSCAFHGLLRNIGRRLALRPVDGSITRLSDI